MKLNYFVAAILLATASCWAVIKPPLQLPSNVEIYQPTPVQEVFDAATRGIDFLRAFLRNNAQRGITVNIGDAENRTALHYAAIHRQPDSIERSRLPEEARAILNRPINYLEVARVLFQAGANVNAQDLGNWTPLIMAIRDGYVEMVGFLIEEAHADVNTRDMYRRTPLFHIFDRNTLISAHEKEQEEILSLLLKAGADVNAHDHYGQTPLFSAVLGSVALLKILLGVGADVNTQDSNKQTPLFRLSAAVFLFDESTKEKFELLLKAGADVNAIDEHGHTPLFYVVDEQSYGQRYRSPSSANPGDRARYKGMVKLLLDAGARIDPESERLLSSDPEMKRLMQEARAHREWLPWLAHMVRKAGTLITSARSGAGPSSSISRPSSSIDEQVRQRAERETRAQIRKNDKGKGKASPFWEDLDVV